MNRAGFTVLETDNVTTALEIARRDDVELVVERPALRCVVMSGHDEHVLSSVVEPALDARFIQKPFTPTEFLTSVHETLGMST
jgi:hypothetical protein